MAIVYDLDLPIEEKSVHKKELVQLVSKRIDLKQKECYDVINALIDVVGGILSETDRDIVLPNLGVFKTHRQEARASEDFSGNAVKVPAHKRVSFKTAKDLKHRLIVGDE